MKNGDDIRYGFSLYPFAIVIAIGYLIQGIGPTLVQRLVVGTSGGMAVQAVLVLGILAVQLIGLVVIAAGLFGALYRVIQDAKA